MPVSVGDHVNYPAPPEFATPAPWTVREIHVAHGACTIERTIETGAERLWVFLDDRDLTGLLLSDAEKRPRRAGWEINLDENFLPDDG